MKTKIEHSNSSGHDSAIYWGYLALNQGNEYINPDFIQFSYTRIIFIAVTVFLVSNFKNCQVILVYNVICSFFIVWCSLIKFNIYSIINP